MCNLYNNLKIFLHCFLCIVKKVKIEIINISFFSFIAKTIKINIPVFKTDEFGHQETNLPIGINFNGVIEKEGKYYSITMKY